MLSWAVAAALASPALPVRDVAYRVDVSHAYAEITFEQTFVNDREHFVEGVYTFPLPEAAAVDGLVIEVGGRTIEGRIEDRDVAQAQYRAAVAEGRVAALTQESRPNLFVQRVGNVPPGGTVEVALRLVQPLVRRAGTYELVLPLVAAPRFVPDDAEPGAGWEPGPWVGADRPLTASIDLTVASALPVHRLWSPTHAVLPRREGPNRIAVAWRTPADRDVVVRWTTGSDAPTVGLALQDGHALLTVEAPAEVPPEAVIPRELVWIVDQSASMRGVPLALARSAMLRVLDQLDERDSLWLLPSTDWLAPSTGARPVTPWTRTLAKGLVQSLEARGPTPLREALEGALGRPVDPNRERTVVVVSDGLVANDLDVLRATADRLGAQRLFTIGPGPAPNRYLLTELARIGGGAATFLRAGEDPAEVVERFDAAIRAPGLTDVTIDWGD
ncbi:MAG: VIT domain-containing protein, partial [Myxococcota bacterium]